MNCKPLEENSQISSMNFNIQNTEMHFHNVGQGSCKLKQTITKIGKKNHLGNKVCIISILHLYTILMNI